MTDTPPEIAELVRHRLMARSAEERFLMGVRMFDAARAMTQSRAIVTIAAMFLAFASVVVVLWLGANDVVGGRMSGGELSQFLLYAVLGAGALGQLSEVWNEVSQAAGAAARIGELIAVEPRIVAPSDPAPLPSPARGEIAFEKVGFAYPGRPDEPVLRSLNLRVAPGEVVAIVGPSGAGKSTLFQLLERFYDPSEGAVLVDGVDIACVVGGSVAEGLQLMVTVLASGVLPSVGVEPAVAA